MSRAFWKVPARADLAAADSYHRQKDPDYGYRLGHAAIAASRVLSGNPRIVPVLGGTTRKWRIRRTNHLLINRIVGNGVEIVRMHHAPEIWRTGP